MAKLSITNVKELKSAEKHIQSARDLIGAVIDSLDGREENHNDIEPLRVYYGEMCRYSIVLSKFININDIKPGVIMRQK